MANTPGSKKAARKIERRTEVNRSRRSRVRTFLRRFDEAVTAGDPKTAAEAFRGQQRRGPQEHRIAQGVAPRRPAQEACDRLT